MRAAAKNSETPTISKTDRPIIKEALGSKCEVMAVVFAIRTRLNFLGDCSDSS